MNTIVLSDGTIYKPVKSEKPVPPCEKCKDKDKAKWGACNAGFGVCAAYMDYEYMNALYRVTVFDKKGNAV